MTQVRCDANATGKAATEWGLVSIPCNTRKGLRTMIDATGTVRYFCGTNSHKAQVERRFGRLSEATRIALAIQRISADFQREVDDRPGVEPCSEDGHVDGCPGRAGGDHELIVVENHGAYVVTADRGN